MKTVVVTIQDSQLASQLAQSLESEVLKIKVGKFFDTETYVDFEDTKQIKGSVVIFVHRFLSSRATVSIDQQLIELLLSIETLNQFKPKKIIAIFPYLPYSRQDKNFHKNGVGLIKFWGKAFKLVGVNHIIAADLHEPGICDSFDTSLIEIKSSDFWIEFLRQEFIDEILEKNIVIASPDSGGIKRVSEIASALNLPMIHIKKFRIAPDQPVALELVGQINCKNAIIIDDIIDTGRTALKACNLLKQNGINKVFGIFVHQTALQQLVNSELCECFERIMVTDTLINDNNCNSKFFRVSLNDFLVQKIKNLIG